jgi:hypothetical protein
MSPDGAMILVQRPVAAFLLAASAAIVVLMLRPKAENLGGSP